MQLWNLQSNEKTRAKRKLKGSTPEGSDPKDSPTTTTTTTIAMNDAKEQSKNLELEAEEKCAETYASYCTKAKFEEGYFS